MFSITTVILLASFLSNTLANPIIAKPEDLTKRQGVAKLGTSCSATDWFYVIRPCSENDLAVLDCTQSGTWVVRDDCGAKGQKCSINNAGNGACS